MDDFATVSDEEGPDEHAHVEQEPPLGSHLTASRRGYCHHGVYVGKGRVVHYSGFSGGVCQCGPVEEVSLSRFAIGRPILIVEHAKSLYTPHEIIRRARSRLGENDYRLLTNNCEHFCNWCLDGVSHSAQVRQPLQLPFRILNSLITRRTHSHVTINAGSDTGSRN
jgi:hypothetical protein